MKAPFWAVLKHVSVDLNCVLSSCVLSELLEKEKILRKSGRLKDDHFYYLAKDLEEKFFIGRAKRKSILKTLIEKDYLSTKYYSDGWIRRLYFKINHAKLNVSSDTSEGVTSEPPEGVSSDTSEGVNSDTLGGVSSEPPYKEIINKETIKKEIIDKEKSLNIKLSPEWVLRKWNSLGTPFKKARGLGKARLKKVEKHLKSVTSKEEWEEFFSKIEGSSFLRGVAAKEDLKYSFDINLDWCLKDDKFFGILEGKYDDKGGSNLANDGQGLEEIYRQYS